MNSIMERFFRTVRREALDNFLLTGKSQVRRILDEYIAFYNSQRPHQGIQQGIPRPGWVASSLLQISGVTDGKSPPCGLHTLQPSAFLH
jgi:hypothetical protein